MIFAWRSLGTLSLHSAFAKVGSSLGFGRTRNLRVSQCDQRRRLGNDQLSAGCAGDGGKLRRRRQIIDNLSARWLPAAGQAFESGNDAIEFARIARQCARESVEIGHRAADRLGIVSQNGVETPERISRGIGHALSGRRVRSQNEWFTGRLSWMHSEARCRLAMSPQEPRSGPGNPIRPSCRRALACRRPRRSSL